jgi:hypothetical protein
LPPSGSVRTLNVVPDVAGAWLALAGCVVLVAALVVLGTLVPFNDGPAVEMTSLIDQNGGCRAVEPIGAAILAAVLVLLTGRLAGASSALSSAWERT